MGSLAIAFLQSTPTIFKMKYCSALLVLAFAAYAQAGQWVYVEDPAEYHHLNRRSAQEQDLIREQPLGMINRRQGVYERSIGCRVHTLCRSTQGWSRWTCLHF